jgi:hypothetical protein
MADSFKGSDKIDIQPGDANVPLQMRLNPASGSTKNDGAIPYGSTVATATFKVHYAETNSSATGLLSNTSEAGVSSSNVIIAYFSYSSSTTLASGLYHVTATVGCSLSGSTVLMYREFDFNRIYKKDR